MLATSWIAKDKIAPIWLALEEPKTYKREALAKLAGIPVSNLSSMNTGKMPMTMEMAQRIIRARPNVTLLDLGAPSVEDDESSVLALDRLARLEDRFERLLEALVEAGIDVPESTGDGRSSPSGAESQEVTG